jgi:hypothetical protein
VSDDKKYGRKDPPEHSEWTDIWDALEKADKGWIITGPIYAVVSNWKALLVIGFVIFAVNSPRIVAAIEALMGGLQ